MGAVAYTEGALRDLRKLDKSTVDRILRRVRWTAENLEATQHVALRGYDPPAFRLRVGDYRVIYDMVGASTLRVLQVGHRREVYR